jgi:hypothetical protein
VPATGPHGRLRVRLTEALSGLGLMPRGPGRAASPIHFTRVGRRPCTQARKIPRFTAPAVALVVLPPLG